jgi:hypothetical protein
MNLRYMGLGGYHVFDGVLCEGIFGEVWISCLEVFCWISAAL